MARAKDKESGFRQATRHPATRCRGIESSRRVCSRPSHLLFKQTGGPEILYGTPSAPDEEGLRRQGGGLRFVSSPICGTTQPQAISEATSRSRRKSPIRSRARPGGLRQPRPFVAFPFRGRHVADTHAFQGQVRGAEPLARPPDGRVAESASVARVRLPGPTGAMRTYQDGTAGQVAIKVESNIRRRPALGRASA